MPINLNQQKREMRCISLFCWSKWRDSNSRPPVPEASRSSLLTTFVCFLVLSSPKTVLSGTLVHTVSAQSKSVDGQRCGHRAISVKLKARKLNRIYPVLSFPSAISIPYISILVNRPFWKLKICIAVVKEEGVTILSEICFPRY